MKTIFVLLTFLLSFISLPSGAEDFLSGLSERVKKSGVSFVYEYETSGKVKVNGEGIAKVRGIAFVFNGNGVEVVSDGKVKWTIDRKGKEVVVENLTYDVIPIIPDKFTKSQYYKAKIKGVDLSCIDLKPKFKSNIVGIKLCFFKSVLRFAVVRVNDGTETFFTIADMKDLQKGDMQKFSFDTSALDSSWIITDLR